MGKNAARKKTTTAEGDLQQASRMLAKQQFISSALDMGWQLAITVLVPVFIGVQLDNHFHTSPSYTLAALFLAIGGAAMIVSKTIKGLSTNDQPKPKGGR